ncbi:MAG: FecR domain-containing protein [Tannerella sp.]|jgi:ferric-dicitrate binding protein FerR (iron transport regulator)|nr:FecR domain-containing protein [Tannerella sp.]
MNQIPEYIEELLTALFAGEISDTEAKILREWVNVSAENARLLEAYRKTNFALTYYAHNDKYDVDKAWMNVTRTLRKTSTPGHLRRMVKLAYRYAAVFILAFVSGVAAMYFYASPGTQGDVNEELFYTEYTVPYGSKSMITLPDSSSIWLNAGSKLRYSSAFNKAEREVFIEGEAYFKVARNEQKPFFVKSSAVTLKVLGTSFNIKAYPEEDNVETTVESGSVQVLRNVKGQLMDKLVLTAGQKVTVIKSSGTENIQIADLNAAAPLSPAQKNIIPKKTAEKTTVTKNVMTELYTSWKDARWLIKQESLGSLAVKLERRYNIHVSFADESLKNISFSGTLQDETLEQVLEAIKLSAPVNYTIQKNMVKLSANKWIATREDRIN